MFAMATGRFPNTVDLDRLGVAAVEVTAQAVLRAVTPPLSWGVFRPRRRWVMDERNPAIGIIGTGVMGKGLALALAAKGYGVVGAYSRSASSAQWVADRIPGCRVTSTAQELAGSADLVFITTPDSAIMEVAASVSWRPGQGVAHCCGAAPIELLQPAADQGAITGAFHPFQTLTGLADPGGRRLQAYWSDFRRRWQRLVV